MPEYKVSGEIAEEKEAMRDAYNRVLMDMARTNRDIVVMDADLMNSIGTVAFAEAYPEQAINCGIQEANMVGIAAGLSTMGKIPYVHTFGCFASRRVMDQVFISCAYAQANVRIIGSDPGVTATYNGGTHMPFEDMGVMRLIPGVTVIEPTDSVMLEDILRQLEKLYGVFYVRLSRKNAEKIYEDGSTFEIGKVAKVREGSDVTIVASGIMVAEAVRAAEELESEGISAEVLNAYTLKPIDAEGIAASVRKTGAVVTAENHNYINGLGSAVAEVIGEHIPAPLERVGVRDEFGEVGSVDYLQKRFGLTSGDIAGKARAAVSRKNA